MNKKDKIWSIVLPFAITLAIAIYSQFDFFFASNNKEIIDKGYYQFIKIAYSALFIGGGITWFLFILKNTTLDQSSTIKKLHSTKNEINKAKKSIDESLAKFEIQSKKLNENRISELKEFTIKAKEISEKFNRDILDEFGISELSNNSDKINSLARFFSHSPFDFFKMDINHTGVIGTLIKKSLDGGLTTLKNVEPREYMKIIWEAITFTQSFCGVNRYAIHSFYEGFAMDFHETFHNRLVDINPKGRIFILDDDELNLLNNELSSTNRMPQYHLETFGVNTFITTEKKIKDHFNVETINDFGIFDNLIIRYDYDKKELNYKLKDKNDLEHLIFKTLFDEIENRSLSLFEPLFLYTYSNDGMGEDGRIKYSLKKPIFNLPKVDQFYEMLAEEQEVGIDESMQIFFKENKFWNLSLSKEINDPIRVNLTSLYKSNDYKDFITNIREYKEQFMKGLIQ